MALEDYREGEDMSEDDFDGLVADIKAKILPTLRGSNAVACFYALIELAYQGCQDQEDLEFLRDVIDEVDDEFCDQEVTLQ